MTFWNRLLITLLIMLVASFLAGMGWSAIFDSRMPSYLGGLVGGLSALPVWEGLKKISAPH